MLGRTLNAMFPARDSYKGEQIIKVDDIHFRDKVKGVSFEVKAGEVLGIAGLVGSGRTETVRAIFAAEKKSHGKIFLEGKEVHFRSPHTAVREGIGMIPEDRKKHGIILSLSIKQNISLTNLKEVSTRLGLSRHQRKRTSQMN